MTPINEILKTIHPPITPTCGQCQHFESNRGTCSRRKELWIHDRGALMLRKACTPQEPACPLYQEATPF